MGIPAWAMALAAPYGLEKFVVEPAKNIYGMAQDIRNDINTREDDAKKLGIYKKIGSSKTQQDIENNLNDLNNTDFNSSAAYTDAYGKNEAQRSNIIETQQVADASDYATAYSQWKGDPVEFNRQWVASGRAIPVQGFQKLEKGIQEMRAGITDGLKRFTDQQKQENDNRFQQDIASLPIMDAQGNPRPYNEVTNDIRNFAAARNVDPKDTLAQFKETYERQLQPGTREVSLGRTRAKYNVDLFGNKVGLIQDTTPVTNIHVGSGGTSGKVTPKDYYKEMNRARAAYDKAVQGQLATIFDADGNPLQTTSKKFTPAELENMRNTANQARRIYQQATGAKTMAPINDNRKTTKQRRTGEPSAEVAQQYVNRYGSVEEAKKAWLRGD